MARALYDNIAESPDELPFRKGEILTVLEQNTAGLEGWWLCSLRGRQVTTKFYLLLIMFFLYCPFNNMIKSSNILSYRHQILGLYLLIFH